ncbi:MAG: DUF2085 domain-containing protein [bacterium]
MDLLYDFLFRIFSPLCHQIAERSFQSFDGKQFFVCARDTGTYLGFLFSFLIVFTKNYKLDIIAIIVLFLIHLLIFGVDGATSYLGMRETNNLIRYFSGFYVGFYLGLIFLYAECFLKNLPNTEMNVNNKLILNMALYEAFATILFIITAFVIKYLLYVLAFSIFFYVYKIFKIVLFVIFNYRFDWKYYLTFGAMFLVFILSLFVMGIFKINIVFKAYGL